MSGLKMNASKSPLMLLGNHRLPPDSYRGIQISETVKILGIVFKQYITEEESYKLNFAPQLKKIDNICSTWTNRNLSIKGKITVINSLMASMLQYPCSCSTTPTRVITQFKENINELSMECKAK